MHEVTVWQAKEKALTSSRNVAEVFGKEHRNVLRDIDELIAQLDKDFRALNFELSEYTSGEGNFQKTHREYLLTKDGFTLLAMGFKGKRALAFKIAYINAFNRLLAEREAQAVVDSQINAQLSCLVDRQEAMQDHINDALDIIERELAKAKKYINKANSNLQMIHLQRNAGEVYRQEIQQIADNLGQYCQRQGRMNPALSLESPKKRRKKKCK